MIHFIPNIIRKVMAYYLSIIFFHIRHDHDRPNLIDFSTCLTFLTKSTPGFTHCRLMFDTETHTSIATGIGISTSPYSIPVLSRITNTEYRIPTPPCTPGRYALLRMALLISYRLSCPNYQLPITNYPVSGIRYLSHGLRGGLSVHKT